MQIVHDMQIVHVVNNAANKNITLMSIVNVVSNRITSYEIDF